MSNTISKSKVNIYKKKSHVISGSKPSGKIGSIDISQSKKSHKPYENLSEFEQRQVLRKMKAEYSLILFDYYSSQNSIQTKILNFAREAFTVNLPISKVIEIHASLIDDLEYQLMLEGMQCGEYINNFRLTLIDAIARLGELYRNRSSTL